VAYQVRITGRARADIDQAVAWLANRSERAARHWHAALREKVLSLEEHPERCPLAAEAESLGLPLRELLFGKRSGVYRILFTVEGESVNVLHVRHAARDWLRPEDEDPEAG
jgi:plasmid stabilization system protein ParE